MNPRVVLLLASASLFVAMWSLDSRHQSAVMIARRTATTETAARDLPAEFVPSVALLPMEAPTTQDAGLEVQTVSLVEPVAAPKPDNRPEMGWDCFRENCARGENETSENSEPVSHEDRLQAIPAAARSDEIPMDDLWIFEGLEISFPAELAAGEYRAVSDRGDVRSLTVTREDLLYHGIADGFPPRDFYSVETTGVHWYFIRVKSPADTIAPQAVDMDWPAVYTAIGSWIRSDAHLAAWRGSDALERLQRRINAIGRRTQSWAGTAIEAIQQAANAINSPGRISLEEPLDTIRR